LLRLSKGDFDDGETCALVSTSYPGMAAAIRAQASSRDIAIKVLVLEYDDVESPDLPTAFTDTMAHDALAFFALHVDAQRLVLVCDGGVSRSSAFLAGFMRVEGRSDLTVFADPIYYPNLLVYGRLMAAVQEDLTEEDLVNLRELKQAKRFWKAKKSNGNQIGRFSGGRLIRH